MNKSKTLMAAGLLAATLFSASQLAQAEDVSVKLTGAEEVPAVTTEATAAGKISVAKDLTVTGSIKTKGIVGTAAHIHEAAAGRTGRPSSPSPRAETTPSRCLKAQLTEAQYQTFKTGGLYVNVHSAEHKPGRFGRNSNRKLSRRASQPPGD